MITVLTWMSNRKEEGLLGFVTNNIPVSEVKGMPHPKMYDMLFTSPGGIEEQINYMFQMSHLPLTICLSNFLAIVFHKVLQSTKKLF